MKLRSFALGAMVVSVLGAAWLQSGCGSSEGSEFIDPNANRTDDGGGSSSGASGFVPSDGGDGVDEGGNGGSCAMSGRSCGDAGVCAGGECCSPLQACDTTCCAGDTICSFQKCVTPGATCFDSSDCAASEYCELSLGSTTTTPPDASCVGASDRTGKCLPKPPECPAGVTPPANGPITCLQKCELPPPAPNFSTALKASWGGETVSPYSTDVMMAPIVIQLDDDDCDGKITERDIPEIVFSTFTNKAYNSDGVLHAISLKNGTFVEKWKVPNDANTVVVHPTKHIAAANFDGKPGNEVVACGADGKVYAFNGIDGSVLWSSVDPMTCFMPSIADLEGDGSVEVIVEGGILNGADGTVKHLFEDVLDGPFVISDIDEDGSLDVVTYARGYSALGLKFVDTGKTTVPYGINTGDWKGPWPAVADFTGDGKPEVIGVDNDTHTVHMWRYDATKPEKYEIVREPVDMNALFDESNKCPKDTRGELHGGGPPTIGDFDKDGVPDVALAGGIGYVVFDGKKLRDPAIAGKDAILWSKVTTDCSSASTGSTLFDFDGDGKAEVVYSDEVRLRVYEGATGKELASFCNTTATLSEFPIVADVDNDGQADIIAVSNAYHHDCDGTRQAGVRVFGPASGNWVRTRRVWNEHAYHVTNVAEDGTIPKPELANWKQTGLDNFRQNKQPGSEFSAPNLVASLSPLCAEAGAGVTITIRNVGEAAAPKGVVIGVYDGATKLGSVTTSRQLYPAEAEPLDFVFPAGTKPTSVKIVIDDGAPAHPSWAECRTDDNTATIAVTTCGSGIK